MNQELLNQAKALFDSPEKWNAFSELVSHRNEIMNEWCYKFKEEANKKFFTDEFVEGWVFISWGYWDMRWYQKAHGDKSISLLFAWAGDFRLECDPEYYDTVKIYDLLRTEKYARLLSCFDRIDIFFNIGSLAVEKKNYSFSSPYDTKFDAEMLTWYAGNKTEDLLSQIVTKVNRFRKDQEINSLLNELNSLTKINRE